MYLLYKEVWERHSSDREQRQTTFAITLLLQHTPLPAYLFHWIYKHCSNGLQKIGWYVTLLVFLWLSGFKYRSNAFECVLDETMKATRVYCLGMFNHFTAIKISIIQVLYMKSCLLITMYLFRWTVLQQAMYPWRHTCILWNVWRALSYIPLALRLSFTFSYVNPIFI